MPSEILRGELDIAIRKRSGGPDWFKSKGCIRNGKSAEKSQRQKQKQIEKVETNVMEFEILQTEISSMILRNEQVFRDQKLFIENASHELQTPLAIAINKIDLILDQSDLSEKDFVQLAETKNSLWRMVNLNKSLFLAVISAIGWVLGLQPDQSIRFYVSYPNI